MTHHIHHHEVSRYTPKQLYELVADITQYPQFLPWCKGARITQRLSDTQCKAELVIAFKGITERYSSLVTLTPAETEQQPFHILAELIDGPFEELRNEWTFLPTPENGTDIQLNLAFQFKSKMLDALIGGLFGKASEKMISAFRQRARDLYGT